MSIFTKVPMKRPPSNVFNLSHEWKGSISLKKIYPILCMECVPGDNINLQSTLMSRFAPLVAPVMHNASVYTHFFFVPNRLVWPDDGSDSGWENFITGGENGTANPTFPTFTLGDTQYANYPLLDYFGIPDPNGSTELISAIPFAGHTMVHNEYYRDQNLAPVKLADKLVDGSNDPDMGQMCRIHDRSWMHDYFTSALPWTQRGPEATIPLGSTADLTWTGNSLVFENGTGLSDPSLIQRTDGTSFSADDVTFNASTGSPGQAALRIAGTTAKIDVTAHTSIDPNVQVDLSSATAASINDLRNAFRLQEFLENNARGGSRYTEVIYAHFGVRNPDARLQRPEFLGGAGNPIQFSEVLQTSSTDATSAQGNMSGHGISVGGNKRVKYYVKEHGYIFGYVSVMPKSSYFQGIPKHFMKFDKFDYYWKEFAHLGEQPILNKELYLADDGENDDVFGYTPRYAEYKYLPSTVHGNFRTTEKYWTMVREFATRPYLNDQFLANDDGINRIFADTETEDQVYLRVFHQIKARRPMPYFGRPTL